MSIQPMTGEYTLKTVLCVYTSLCIEVNYFNESRLVSPYRILLLFVAGENRWKEKNIWNRRRRKGTMDKIA